MGNIKKFELVKLFFACTYNINFNIKEFYELIEKKFNTISSYSPIIDFSSFTSYYNNEMGNELKKQIIALSGLYNIDDLHKIKLTTNELELQYSENNNRIINIDPGYLTEAKVLLFTTKNNIHRIYIKDGIYAEITLTYRKNSYDINPMTYADYKSTEFINFFNELRKTLKSDPEFKKYKF